MGINKSKSLIGLGGLAFMAMAMSSGNYPHSMHSNNIDMPDEDKIKRKFNTEHSGKHKGLKAFEYNQGIIWAINEKTADKKAKKKGWL